MNLRKRFTGAWVKKRPGFKWLKRYKLDGKNWACEHSRSPSQSPDRIDQETGMMVIATRKKLENKLYTQIGASNVGWQLRQEGMKSPSISPSIGF